MVQLHYLVPTLLNTFNISLYLLIHDEWLIDKFAVSFKKSISLQFESETFLPIPMKLLVTVFITDKNLTVNWNESVSIEVAMQNLSAIYTVNTIL